MTQEGSGWKTSGDIHTFGVGAGHEVVPTPSEIYTHEDLWEMIPRQVCQGQIPSPIPTSPPSLLSLCPLPQTWAWAQSTFGCGSSDVETVRVRAYFRVLEEKTGVGPGPLETPGLRVIHSRPCQFHIRVPETGHQPIFPNDQVPRLRASQADTHGRPTVPRPWNGLYRVSWEP